MNHPATGEPITYENSLINGADLGREFFDCLDFAKAREDRGPSPAGNRGPYLHVPMHKKRAESAGFSWDTTHRVYPKFGLCEGDQRRCPKVATWEIGADKWQVCDDHAWSWAFRRYRKRVRIVREG